MELRNKAWLQKDTGLALNPIAASTAAIAESLKADLDVLADSDCRAALDGQAALAAQERIAFEID